MDTKQEIFRRYFREFDSIRKIARDLRISRITVKKQLADREVTTHLPTDLPLLKLDGVEVDDVSGAPGM